MSSSSSASRALPGLGAVPGDARATLCLPEPRRRLPVTAVPAPACCWPPCSPAAALDAAALAGGARPPAAGRPSRPAWCSPRPPAPRGRRGPRPGHLAGGARAGHPADRGAGGAARGAVGRLGCGGPADHLAGLLRPARPGRRAVAGRDRPGVLRRRRGGGRRPTRAGARSSCSPSCCPGRARFQALARAVPCLDPRGVRGAPLSVATFLAGTSKVGRRPPCSSWCRRSPPPAAPVLSAVAGLAVLSMTLGNVMALRQDNVVRLLAWSTVAQAGWVVLPLAAVSTAGSAASAGYLLAYLVATLLASPWWPRSGPRPRGSRTRGLLGRGRLRSTRCWPAAGPGPAVPGRPAARAARRRRQGGGAATGGRGRDVGARRGRRGQRVLGVAVYLRWLRVLLGTVPGEQPRPVAGRGRGAGRRRPHRPGGRGRAEVTGPPPVLAAAPHSPPSS